MTRPLQACAAPLSLGVEGGATHTVALVADDCGQLVAHAETGPANLKLLSDAKLLALLCSLATKLPRPAAVAIGLAGARTEEDRNRIRRAAARVWPATPCHATNDLETALAAAPSPIGGSPASPGRVLPAAVRVLVLSGTGSCCHGRRADGTTARVGGWGHLLGDRGSGYEIGLQALRGMIHQYDQNGRWTVLGQRVLRALLLNGPEALVGWVQGAEKSEVAALAPEVFAAAAAGDAVARRVVREAAETLASDAVACAHRLVRRGVRLQFVLAGSVLLKQPGFARRVAAAIGRAWPAAEVTPLKRESAWGAVELARTLSRKSDIRYPISETTDQPGAESPSLPSLASLVHSPTEQRNPRSAKLDRLPLGEAIDLMLSESARVAPALTTERAKIETAIRWIVRGLRAGGRLFYVGAGTSGRLGVLDASECPPTFRTAPDQVQGIMAGGPTALWQSIEGAEDDSDAGAQAVGFRGVGGRDVVVGIAASGRTPFVWGALAAARRQGARTILLCFNPHLELPARNRPHLVIAPDVGPEVLTGSTRLNAGTATKVVLNLFTTLAMVRLGKVVSNLMIDVNPSNLKLRDRAVRIVRVLAGVDEAEARAALEKSGWVVKRALAVRFGSASRRRLRRSERAGSVVAL
jgi:N-acetylmuramic acid 6-phosphate etherase